MIFYSKSEGSSPVRLTGSTSNAGRTNGGTPYYRVASAGGISFLCRDVEEQIPLELIRIQVDPELIPLIRASYTHELAQKLGHLKPDEKFRLEAALKAVDEEARMARDYLLQEKSRGLSGIICGLSGRNRNFTSIVWIQPLELSQKSGCCVIVWNAATYRECKGIVKLELRTPFAYLKDLTDEIRSVNRREGIRPQIKIGGEISADPHPECSNWIQAS